MIDLAGQRAQDLAGRARDLAVEIAAVGGLPPHRAQSVAEGVAAFCAEHAGRLAPTRPLLHMLAARALAAVGEREAAAVFAARVTRDGDEAAALVEALARPDLPPDLLIWMALGLVRPFVPAEAGAAPGWLADFRRLQTAGEGLELTGRRVVRQTVECMAPLWEEGGGRGMLGLRHVTDLARHGRGAQPGPGLVAACQQLAGYAGDVLAACARRRGWPARPRTVLLDAMC